MAVQKISKKDVDEMILELLKLEDEKKALDKRIKEIKSTLESQYQLDKNQKEIIIGEETYYEKIPVNTGRNSYDVEKLRPYLKAIRCASKVIKKVEMVDVNELNKLVQIGKLPPEVLDKCRLDKWTFKSAFKRIEAKVKSREKRTVA